MHNKRPENFDEIFKTFDDYRLNPSLPSDRNKSGSTKRFSKSNKSSSIDLLEATYNKLVDLNEKKMQKLRKLKDSIDSTSRVSLGKNECGYSEPEQEKARIMNSIKSAETKYNDEDSSNSQLKYMLSIERLAKVTDIQRKIQEANKSMLDVLSTVTKEHEKAQNLASNAQSANVLAVTALSSFASASKASLNNIASEIAKKKRSHQLLQASIKKKSNNFSNFEKVFEHKSLKCQSLLNEISSKYSEFKQSEAMNKQITHSLSHYKSAFNQILHAIGQASLTPESLQIIITTLQAHFSKTSSLSDRYFNLSQNHSQKISEFNKSIAELIQLASSSDTKILSNSFNTARSEILNVVIKVDSSSEELILRIYSNTCQMLSRLLSLVKLIQEMVGVPSKIIKPLGNLDALLSHSQHFGRQTIFKALTQTNLLEDTSQAHLKFSIVEETLKLYPGNTKLARELSFINESSPVLKFFLTQEVFERFLTIEDPIKNCSNLIQECFGILSSQYQKLISNFIGVAVGLQNYEEDDMVKAVALKKIPARRYCVHVRSSTNIVPQLDSSSGQLSLRQKPKKQIDLSSVKKIRSRLDLLQTSQRKACKSNEQLQSALPLLRSFEKSNSFIKKNQIKS